MFYPVKRQIIVGMGDNKGGRMGKQELKDLSVPGDRTLKKEPVLVAASRFHSMYLTKNGQLWGAGRKDTDNEISDYEKLTLPKNKDKVEEEVDKIFCGRASKWFIAKSGKTFFKGVSREFNLPYDKTVDSFTELKLPISDKDAQENIVDIACGNQYNLLVTDKGKLWALGRPFLKRVGISDFY